MFKLSAVVQILTFLKTFVLWNLSQKDIQDTFWNNWSFFFVQKSPHWIKANFFLNTISPLSSFQTAASSGDPHVHVIKMVKPEDEGLYTCVAGNFLGQAEASAYLEVSSASRFFLLSNPIASSLLPSWFTSTNHYNHYHLRYLLRISFLSVLSILASVAFTASLSSCDDRPLRTWLNQPKCDHWFTTKSMTSNDSCFCWSLGKLTSFVSLTLIQMKMRTCALYIPNWMNGHSD